MKKLLSFFLALALTAGALAVIPSAQGTDDHEASCTGCKIAGDLNQNGKVDTDDAIYLLFRAMFPERYPLPAHEGHGGEDCALCLASSDMDQNGRVDSEDAIYLLFHSQFPSSYRLPGCTYRAKLSAGYARVDITPEEPMEIYGSTATSAHDPLQMTCTAVYDGESTALLFSLDLRNFSVSFTEQMTDVIKKEFGIPADHVILNITHTHSTPTIGSGAAAASRWRGKILRQLPVVVQAALDDLDEIETAYTGTAYTDGITFVRRYLLADGSYDTNPSDSDKPVAHETEADTEMRTIRLDRKNKKDILMVNYQTHYGSATSLYKGQYSADFVHVFREEAERKWDCHFVYHSGASGNLNFVSALPGERKYSNFVAATTMGLVPAARRCMESEKEVSLGKLHFSSDWVTAPVYQDTPEDIAKAKIVHKSGYDTDSAEYKALAKSYGFAGYRQVQGIVTRAGLGKTLDVPFYAVSFGDIGFVTAPYEMFDTNGVQVREGSPFQVTFVCSYSNGGFGYVPSSIAFPHKSYEVYVSRFCETTGDDFAVEMIRLLEECKKQK